MFDKIITGIITIGSLFYSNISGVSPRFEPSNLGTRGENVIVSTCLTNCFSDDMDNMLSSGQEIKIQFKIKVYIGNSHKASSYISIYHSIKYSLLDRFYEVYYSETDEIYELETLRNAKNVLKRISGLAILSREDMLDGESRFIKISASLNKIYLDGIDKEVNLMYYWNSIKPEIKTESFTSDIFTQ